MTQPAWSDEFDGPAGSLPNGSHWTFDLGGGGWGNNELETYTNSPTNVHLDGQGHLVIHVEKSGNGYTSARIKTQNLSHVGNGHIEARIKVPGGQGLWPAFWMLGSDFNGSNWPTIGEVDIMENVGNRPNDIFASVHGPGYSGAQGISRTYSGPTFSDGFHVFAVDWSPLQIQFSVDGTVYHTVTPTSLPTGARWVFDHPFFVILNVAVGGTLGGAVSAPFATPDMIIDYVRFAPSSQGITLSSIRPGLALPSRGSPTPPDLLNHSRNAFDSLAEVFPTESPRHMPSLSHRIVEFFTPTMRAQELEPVKKARAKSIDHPRSNSNYGRRPLLERALGSTVLHAQGLQDAPWITPLSFAPKVRPPAARAQRRADHGPLVYWFWH